MRSSDREYIAFVVLHYVSAELTRACIDSILVLANYSNRFAPSCVVVDNASGNASLEELELVYGNCPEVAFVRNPANLGFSRANNIGFREAVTHFSPAHVVVLNNDTEILQLDFLDMLDQVASETGAHVVGPDVFVARKGFHQSPMLAELPGEEGVQAKLAGMDAGVVHGRGRLKRAAKKALLATGLGRRLLSARMLYRMRHRTYASRAWKTASYGTVVLHGAAVAFTSRFLETGEYPFMPETFLYREELILAARCDREGWLRVYDPRLQVIHYDDGSTDAATGGGGAKDEFVRRHSEESYRVFATYYLSYERPIPLSQPGIGTLGQRNHKKI